MVHHFPFDPRVILGVSSGATPDEVREAYRQKSKKHHPDLGGDEWAFRMVARAYEVLKSTGDGGLDSGSGFAPVYAAEPGPGPWTRPASPPPPPPTSGFFAQGWFPFGGAATAADAAGAATAEPGPTAGPTPGPAPEPELQRPAPGIFQTVEAELIWIRFDLAGQAQTEQAAEGSTLSVCMVVSWPRRALVSRTAEYINLGDTLHRVIDSFNDLQKGGALAVRSRIEDGQFVGWLSFPDVVVAQAAFLALRDDLKKYDLTVQLQTRDEIIPPNWAG